LSKRTAQVGDAEQLDALTEVSRHRIVVNALSSYGRYGVALLVTLFLQAYIIRSVGRVEYSIWPLVATVTGFATLIPLAISGGVNRYLAHAYARKSLVEVEQITTSVFMATLAAALLYVAAIVGFAFSFERIFDIPAGAAGVGPWVMLLVGIAEAFRIPVGVYQGGLDAAQKFVAINLREIVVLILYAALVVVAFTVSTPALLWVAAAYALTQLMGAVITWRVARRLLPWQQIKWSAFRWGTLRTVMAFGLWALLGSISILLYWRTGNVIINKLLDPVLVTGYSVVVGILLQGYQLAGLGTGVLFSAATVLHANQDLDRLARMIYRASRVTAALSVPAILFLVFFGGPVMTLYLGDSHYAEYGVYFAVLGPAMIIQLTQIPSRTVPQAFGKNAFNNVVVLLFAAFNVGLSLLLVSVAHWGLMGVAASAAIVIALLNLCFWPWYSAGLLGIGWWRYFTRSLLLPLAHCLPALAVTAGMWALGVGDTLGELVAVAAAVVIVHGAYMLAVGLPREDRKAVLAAVKRVQHVGEARR
jgi:O-antigen/teichoic acid export membrane protein